MAVNAFRGVHHSLRVFKAPKYRQEPIQEVSPKIDLDAYIPKQSMGRHAKTQKINDFLVFLLICHKKAPSTPQNKYDPFNRSLGGVQEVSSKFNSDAHILHQSMG